MTSKEVFDSPESFHAELTRLQEAPEETSAPIEPTSDFSTSNDDAKQEVQDDQVQDTYQDDSQIDNQDDSQDDDKDNKIMVPKKRLDQELKRRKEWEEQAIKTKHELDLLNNTIKEFFQNNNDEQQHAQNKDDFEPLDTEAYDRTQKQLEDLQKQQAVLIAETNRIHYANTLNEQQKAFTQSHPDFTDAYAYLKNVKFSENKALGLDEASAREAAMKDIGDRINYAVNTLNKNAAEVAYNLAKAYGYNPKSKQQPQNIPNLQKIEENLKRTKSVQDTPAAPAGPVSAASYLTPEGFQTLVGENNAVDKKLFHKALEAIKNQR